jgi:hypothetical protein
MPFGFRGWGSNVCRAPASDKASRDDSKPGLVLPREGSSEMTKFFSIVVSKYPSYGI